MKINNSWAAVKLLLSVFAFYSISSDAMSKPTWTKEEILEAMRNPRHKQELKDVEALREKAREQSRNRNYLEAEKIWEGVLESKHKTDEDLRDIALAYDQSGNYIMANTTYNNLIEMKKATLPDLKNFLDFLKRTTEDFKKPLEAKYSVRNIQSACKEVLESDYVDAYDLDLAGRADKWAQEARRGP